MLLFRITERKDDNMEQLQTSPNSTCPPLTQNGPELIFETAVAEAVNDILSTLGESTKQAIYNHLKNTYGIGKDDIPRKIDAFATAIEETFGSVGKVIEIKIIERLHSQYIDFRYTPKNGTLDFVEYVTHLRNRFEPKA